MGAAFVAHSLAVNDIVVGLIEANRSNEVDTATVDPEPIAWRSFVGASGTVEVLKPDLFVIVGSEDLERRWFVEVDRATESLVRVAVKCRHYLTYLRTGREQHDHGVFPKVLWTVPTLKRAAQLRDVFSGLPPPAGRLFDVTVHQHAIDHLKGGAP